MNESAKRGIEVRGNRLRPWVWGGAVALLLLPAVAMQLRATGVDWSAMDFAVFGAMLAVACGLYELATRMNRDPRYRAGAGIAVAAGLLTAWANLAVGMIGSEGNPFNLAFAGVLVVAAIGASLAKLRSLGLAKAMLATGSAQALAAAAGFASGEDPRGAALSLLFVAPWWLSSALFRRASQSAGEPSA